MRKKCSHKENIGKKERNRKKRGEMGCYVGNRNDEERGAHLCFFSDITVASYLGTNIKSISGPTVRVRAENGVIFVRNLDIADITEATLENSQRKK